MRFETIGRSMWPLLRPGDVAVVQPLTRPARPGDVVVYVAVTVGGPHERERADRAPRLVAHRVIETLPDGRLHVRGDFTFTPEPPIEPRQIVGQLTAVDRPGVGRVDLEGPLARALATAIPWVQRRAPEVLAVARQAVVGGVQLADGMWTADPVRRLRRLGPAVSRVRTAIAGESDQAEILAYVRRTGRNPSDFGEMAGKTVGTVTAVARNGPHGGVIAFAFASETTTGTDATNSAQAHWRIRDVHVLHRWRGLGVGRAVLITLLEGISDSIPGPSSPGSKVLVTASTARAVRLFRSLAFQLVAESSVADGHTTLAIACHRRASPI